MSASPLRRTLLLLPALLLTACTAMTPLGNPETPYPPAREPQAGDLFHVPTGTYLTEQQFLDLTTEARIIYLGETHDNPAAHRMQAKVLQHLARRYPGQLALGGEMFTPAQQQALDRWITGEFSEKEFLKAADWQSTWQMDFAYYREVMNIARDFKVPVIGLNAKKDLVRAIGRNLPESLPEEQQRQIPELDLGDPYQAALVEAIYSGHSAGNAMLDGFQRVQTLWDETMANNIANYLQSPAGKDKRMVVIAGGNHIRNGFGIPRRVFRRLPSSYLMVGDRAIVIPESRQDKLMDVRIPEFPMPAFDVIAYTVYEELPQKVRLGILLEETDGKVQISKVMEGSNAARSGLKEGDVITAVDGEPVTETFDLVYAIQQKTVGDIIRLELFSDKFSKTVEVDLQKTKQHHK